MLEELYMRDLANAMKMPAEPLPTGKVTVSGPQVETAPKQPEMGTITGIPQTPFEKALETSGVKLSELGDMIDQSAPGTLNTLLGREVPIIGNLKLRDFLPFVGSKDEGKLTGTPAALIAAGTGQPLRGQPVVSSTVGPDGRTYFSASGSPAMLNEDVGTAVVDVATLGLGKPLAAGAKKAVKATKNMPVGMSTKAVGQGVDELGFYSAAKQAVDAIQQPKGTGQQFLKQIEKTPGVKPDEIKWTGLDEFLQSKKSVTKAEVQEYLDKNRVEIKEVQLGGIKLNEKSEYALPEVMKVINENQGDDFDRIRLALVNDYDAYQALTKKFPNLEDTDNWGDRVLEDIIGSAGGGGPKFSKYTLPGGENYREILLTLPPKKTGQSQIAFKTTEDVDNFLTDMSIQGYEDMPYGRLNDTNVVEFDGAIPSSVMGMIRNNDGDIIAGKEIAGSTYGSPHFEQPNILAHLRVNDRVIDGKKTLFVEEVQSDWHQAGRKKGYSSPGMEEANRQSVIKAKNEFRNYEKTLAEKYGLPPKMTATASIKDRMNWQGNLLTTISDEEKAVRSGLEDKIKSAEQTWAASTKGVPDAPFKTTWSDLSMKRVIQMASEGGYDRIAFTTGKTQAERFGLSRQVNSIDWKGYNERGASKIVNIMPTEGNLIELPIDSNGVVVARAGGQFAGKSIDEIVGKDIAKQIMDTPDGDLAGEGLAVGGEGMKGFYDDILPKFLDKYAKKWDAKTGVTEMKVGQDKVERGMVAPGIDFVGEDKVTKAPSVQVNYIDVTPKMRESVVTKGQPMFAIGAGGAGAAATQEENK